MKYEDFLEKKRHSIGEHGIKPVFIPDQMFDYQKHVAEHAIRKGRCAVFLDTGLGKTIIEITTAINYARHTNKPVLIITPLAVAFQFIKEAEKFGLEQIEYSKDGKFKGDIVVCNYERLHYFNPENFDCVILDESSILKNFDGSTKQAVTTFLKKVKYRFLFTATPSPNDFVELGTSSEALGYLGHVDMLTKFFKNNEDTISPQNIGAQWRLKGHAQEAFFKWVSGWSISMRKPSDLGFSDERHILPELKVTNYLVKNEAPLVINGQIQLFNIVARTQQEIRSEQSVTVENRCAKAVELASLHDNTVYWCNLNREADCILEYDKDAVQIQGSMNLDKKEEILVSFFQGDVKKLVTKPKITAFGLNWQHCNHTVYFPTFSYEQYYQAIRRFWRFGQTRTVFADIVISDGQTRVLDSLMAKAEKANELFSKLNANINQSFEISQRGFDKPISLPNFLK